MSATEYRSYVDLYADKLRRDAEQREAERESMQINSGAVQQPFYRNRNVESRKHWFIDNSDELIRYARELNLPADEIADFIAIQHDRQLLLKQARESDQAAVDRYARRLLHAGIHEPSGQPYFGEL